MRRGWVRFAAAGSGLAVLLYGAPAPVGAEGNAGLHLHKTVDPLQLAITPGIGVSLGVDKTSAIPGDTLTYTAVVTNPTATFAMGGDINAQAVASTVANVAYYWDELEYCAQDCGNGAANPNWTALATFEAAQAGYQPVTPPHLHTGMSFAAASVTRSGVTYPASGDPILGTQISPSATAAWTYRSTVVLTPAQIALLTSPGQASAIRNVLHFEVTARNTTAAQPYTDPEMFSNPFISTSNPGALTNITVTFTLPDGTTAVVGPSQIPGLATLNPGGTAAAGAQFKVPVPAVRDPAETEGAYVLRLQALNGSLLTATAVASGGSFSGPVYATSPAIPVQEMLPIVTIAKGGPDVVNAGDTETNSLALQNVGGATATAPSVVDTVPAGGSGAVSGVPPSLAAGAPALASATYPVPISQAGGDLTDTASVTWKDGNGNPYGPLSSSFTTQVHNILFGARLVLAPASAGPNAPGSSQTLTATLLDSHGNPIGNQVVHFTVTGANAGSGTGITDGLGIASFTYTGANPGHDVVQASVSSPGITITSNTADVSWLQVLQPVVTTAVQGNFFPNPGNSCTFDIGPGSTPAFGQTFPDIMFNPDPAIFKFPPPFIRPDSNGVVFNISTRPFTDITTDVNGNPNGQIVAQGNGLQAGLGSLTNFYAVFNGTFVVNQPGDLTFRILHDDGYIFGVGGSATRVSGDRNNDPATTPFNNYGVIAAWNTSSTGSSSSGPATVHFPAAGTYPYELDYTECGAGSLFLDLLTEQFVAQTNPLAVYVGYADALRAGGSAFPFPWDGSPNTNFFGCPGCPYDSGAIRFDNNSPAAMTFDSITVDIGPNHFDLWPHAFTLLPGQLLILTMTVNDNFDTSDFSPTPCNVNDNVIPKVNVTIAGITTVFSDVNQVLNTGGFDLACLRNESLPWRSISGGGTAINLPLPPAASLNLTPFSVPSAIQGQSLSLTVAALDGSGNPAMSLPVTLQVLGANTQTLNGTTNSAGLVTFTYTGNASGADSVEASAFVGGLRSISNDGSVFWVPPGGSNNPLAPSITSPSPADGSIVTKPVAVTATIVPPSGQTITRWRVFYRALDPGSPVTIASGTGSPPSTLATFDPTVLPNDTYGITVEATASNGAVQDLTTPVTVLGNLKPGRYTTTYQDLSVPVGGFQMEVRRTYDSIDPSSGDFGVGWQVSVSNFRTAPNRVLGAGGWVQYNTSCTLGLCFTGFKNSAPRFVTVTFPDQHTETFDFTPTGGTNLFWECGPAFTARSASALGGSTSSLTALDDTGCSYTGDGNIYGSGGRPYDPQRFMLTTRDGRKLVLDRNAGLVSETDANGNSLTIDNTGVHSTLGPASTPTAGPSIGFLRDGANRITDVNGPIAGQHIHYAYTGDELSAVTDPNGNTSTYTYDSISGRLRLSSDPNSQPLQTLTYDSGGRLVSIANGNQPPTIITTDLGAQQQTFLDPNAQLTTVLTYDDLGDVIQEDHVFNGRTLTTHFSYDAVGRPTGSVDPLGSTVTTLYDESPGPSNGNILSVTSAGGTWSFENYNSLGEAGLVRQPDGSVLVTFTYDPTTGAVLSTQAPGQSPTTLTYTADGQVRTVADPGGRTVNYGYDALGHLVSMADSLGRSVTRVVDAAGQVSSITDQLGSLTQFAYNPDGTMSILTDANLHQTRYFYDSLGRLRQVQDALGHSVFYAYDAAGLLSQETDRNGAITTFAYDADGQLVSEARPNSDIVNYRYDPLGRVIEGDTSATHFDRTYDDAGRMLTETSCGSTGASATPCSVAASGQPVVTLSYTYGTDDQLTSVGSSDPAIGVTRYGYDGVGRLSSLQYGIQGSFTFAYDAAGQITHLNRPNGVNDTFTYNASGDLMGRDATRGGTPVAAFDYGIDPVTGQRTSLTDSSGTHTFSYAANGNLVAANHPLSSGLANEAYSYDAAGNRSTIGATSAFDAADRLLSDGAFNYTYDGEGNLISKAPRSGGAATTYTWNTDHQLIGINYPDGTSSSYRYDAAGRRVDAVDKGTEVRFVYDGLNVAGDYNSQNQLQAGYVPGLEKVAGGTPSYYISDGLGSVRALTDGAGNVTGRYDYNSFGVPSPGNAVPSRDTFTGYQFDSASGLYYAGARYYDPSTGRFLSEDPIPAVNPYPYAANDPTNLIDVLGLDAAAEYGELLMDEANAAQCVSGQVDAVASVGIGAAAAALAGGVPTIAGVTVDLAEASAVAEAQCVAGGKYKYRRPAFRNGVRGKVWDAHIERSTGRVRDRVSGRFMSASKPWDMGHNPGYEFNKLQNYARDTNMDPKAFRDAYNNPDHYSPELPSSNRSHRGEDPTSTFFGP